MTLTLAIRSQVDLGIDFRGATPERLAALAAADIAAVEVLCGNRAVPLGDVCDVAGDPRSQRWRLVGDWSRVHGVGAGMTAGEIVVEGSVGRHAGQGMSGGTLAVAGDAGDWLGAELCGGVIRVAGDAANHVGAPLAGSRRGMTGGAIVIAGRVGRGAGVLMRRGLLAVGGDAGPELAARMLAGTVIVAGRCDDSVGAGMRRGTVVVLGEAPRLGPTFRWGEPAAWPMMQLLARELARMGFKHPMPDRLRIAHGDLLHGGRGEILVAA